MKKLILALALALTTAAFVAGCGDDDEGETQTLNLVGIEQPDSGGDINVGDSGPSPGDGFLIAEDLEEDGEAVGSDAGACTFTGGADRPQGASCEITLDLDDRGSIAVQGLLHFDSDTAELAVVGGTGEFAGASGTLTADISQQKETPLTIEITTEGEED